MIAFLDLEDRLLRSFLKAHVSFKGIYEVLSHVYLPYTLSALFNLIDFSEDEEISTLAAVLADIIVEQLMLCTIETGVANLSASSRGFARTRQRTYGHNMNTLVRLIVGRSMDGEDPTQLSDFLVTTTWRPSAKVTYRFLNSI